MKMKRLHVRNSAVKETKEGYPYCPIRRECSNPRTDEASKKSLCDNGNALLNRYPMFVASMLERELFGKNEGILQSELYNLYIINYSLEMGGRYSRGEQFSQRRKKRKEIMRLAMREALHVAVDIIRSKYEGILCKYEIELGDYVNKLEETRK